MFGQRFDRSGQRLGEEFLVNTYVEGQQGFRSAGVDIAGDDSGAFVVVWNSFSGQDGDGDGVFGQRFASNGQPVGPEFQVNTYTTGEQFPASVACDRDGNFLVTWLSGGADSRIPDGINHYWAQLFDADGEPVGSEFQVNSQTDGYRIRVFSPGLSVTAPGTFVVAWGSDVYDDNSYGYSSRISAQILKVTD